MSRLRHRTALWFACTALPLLVVAGLLIFVDDDRLSDYRPTIIIAVAITVLAFSIGWFGLIGPALRRIDRAAEAVGALAEGRTEGRIDDRVPDEIGELGGNIDRLAAQRAVDSRSRDLAEERLAHHTIHDALTGLNNRQHVRLTLETALAADSDDRIEVVFVDLDDFTLVNELWGQAVGDQVLVSLANRLRRLVGDDILLGRWAGDEFVIVLVNVDHESLGDLLVQLEWLLDEPFNTTAGPQPVSASIVSASAQAGRSTLDELFYDIDAALRQLKEAHARTRAINPDTARLVELALNEDRLEVFYQPIVEMISATGTRMVGAEAFVRLRGDDGQLHVASDFLGDIMLSAYAREIDHRMATKVIADLATWQLSGLVTRDFLVSLNLAPASLRDLDLGRDLVEICAAHQVAPSSVVLDVSEEAGELDQIIAAELRHSGFRLSVDDLGLKHSNFDRLFTVGAEFAKLHRRWVGDEVMLDALVMICQRKGLQVVAAGVETMEQLQLLYDKGVRLCQGYLISYPLSVDDFAAMLSIGRPETAATP